MSLHRNARLCVGSGTHVARNRSQHRLDCLLQRTAPRGTEDAPEWCRLQDPPSRDPPHFIESGSRAEADSPMVTSVGLRRRSGEIARTRSVAQRGHWGETMGRHEPPRRRKKSRNRLGFLVATSILPILAGCAQNPVAADIKCRTLTGCQSVARAEFGHGILLPSGFPIVNGQFSGFARTSNEEFGVTFRNPSSHSKFVLLTSPISPKDKCSPDKRRLRTVNGRDFCYAPYATIVEAFYSSGGMGYEISDVPLASVHPTDSSNPDPDRSLMETVISRLR
jgi:hypothetical protein